MPLYVYNCEVCGDFRAWQAMSECDEAVACPVCGAMSPRRITAPTILTMDPHRRAAHERNEKSQHEPKIVRGEDWEGRAHSHSHTGAHKHAHQSRWPWMIGH